MSKKHLTILPIRLLLTIRPGLPMRVILPIRLMFEVLLLKAKGVEFAMRLNLKCAIVGNRKSNLHCFIM